MLRTWCKADGNHFPGDVIDIDDAIAKDHIKYGHAIEYVEGGKIDPATLGNTPASLSAQAQAAASALASFTPATEPSSTAPAAPAAS